MRRREIIVFVRTSRKNFQNLSLSPLEMIIKGFFEFISKLHRNFSVKLQLKITWSLFNYLSLQICRTKNLLSQNEICIIRGQFILRHFSRLIISKFWISKMTNQKFELLIKSESFKPFLDQNSISSTRAENCSFFRQLSILIVVLLE